MAADAPAKPPAGSPCCVEWQGKYAAMKNRRDAFKQTVCLLEKAYNEAKAEIDRLKQKNQEDGVKTDFEKEVEEKESAARAALEKEVFDLKSEISSLHKRLEQTLRERNEQVKLLQDQASGAEMEITRLKNLLEKETLRADNAEEKRKKVSKESKNAKAEKVKNDKINSLEAHVSEAKKEISQLKELLNSEKKRAESESKKAESEKKKTGQYLSDLEALRTDADKTSLELVSLSSKFEKVSKQLEVEKLKTIKERKRADLESAKAKEQKKQAEQSMKRAKEEQTRAQSFSQQLEMARARIDELQKEVEKQMATAEEKCSQESARIEEQRTLLETKEKIAMDWKSRADNLARHLEEARLATENLQKQVDELLSSHRLMETRTSSPHKVRDVGRAEVRILRKELKFEKKRVKHAKELAKLEKIQKEVLLEELGRLKLEFVHFSKRLNLLDGYFLTDSEGTDDIRKANCRRQLQGLNRNRPSKVNLNSENKSSDTGCNLVTYGSQQHRRQFSMQLIPRSGWELSESISGTLSELKSLIGGSNKKSLESSGVNSSATSFSDGQFVASQGRGQPSLATSTEIARENLDVQPTNSNMFPEVSNVVDNANLCLVAENCLSSPCTAIPEVDNENRSKRKRMVETIESIEYLSSKDKKLCFQIGEKLGMLSSMLVGTVDGRLEEGKTLGPDVQIGSSVNCDYVSKKRKASCEENTTMQPSNEFKRSKIKKFDAKVCKTLVTSGESPQCAGDLTRNTDVSGEKICDSTVHRHDKTTLEFDEVAAVDYMKLLELDKSEDEKYYKMAIESPLSPSLPEIDLQSDEMAAKHENPSRLVGLLANSMDDVCGTIQSHEVSVLHAHNVSPVSSSGDQCGPVHSHIPKHFVVFSLIKDQSSIVRIFYAAKNCIDRCPFVNKAGWAVREILLSLKMEENLSVLEKACVLLSLILYNISLAASSKIGSSLSADALSCLGSFSRHMDRVIADAETVGLLSELLEKLLSLLQEFLSEQRVLSSVKSSETSESDSRINIPVDGENFVLSDQFAPIDQLVAGSAILAATCAAVDRVGFLCEASFEILYKQSHGKTSVLLTVLHVFFYVAGEKIFSLREHSLSTTVLKSIMVFLEDRHLGTMEDEVELHAGMKCPFSGSSTSLEAVSYMLLEILQKFAQSKTVNQSAASSLDSSPLSNLEMNKFSLTHQDIRCMFGMDCEASCCLGKNHSRIIDSVTLCQLCDILSMVELVVVYMAWDWTSVNIVSPLLKLLDLPLAMDFSVAIVSLLGQLGSIGVDACGHEDQGIENMRDKLSAFLQCETTLKAGFAVQIATVSSLLKLLPLDFLKIIQSNATPPGTSSLSNSTNLVAKWFSLLNQEQQTFAFGFFESSL